MQQKVNQKQLLLLKNFKGVVRSLLFLTERRSLPLFTPKVSAMRGNFYDEDRCLAYLLFEPESLSVNSTGTPKLLNFCKTYWFESHNLTLLLPPNFNIKNTSTP
jgi:hypothetical protein